MADNKRNSFLFCKKSKGSQLNARNQVSEQVEMCLKTLKCFRICRAVTVVVVVVFDVAAAAAGLVVVT